MIYWTPNVVYVTIPYKHTILRSPCSYNLKIHARKPELYTDVGKIGRHGTIEPCRQRGREKERDGESEIGTTMHKSPSTIDETSMLQL